MSTVVHGDAYVSVGREQDMTRFKRESSIAFFPGDAICGEVYKDPSSVVHSELSVENPLFPFLSAAHVLIDCSPPVKLLLVFSPLFLYCDT